MPLDNLKSNLPKLIFTALLLIGVIYLSDLFLTKGFQQVVLWGPVILLPLCFIYWRQTLLFIPIWILIEGLIRKHIYDSVLVLFIKDAALAMVYFRLTLESMSTGRSFILKTPINKPVLVLLVWYILQLFNPNLSNMLIGLVGIKVIFFYIPFFFLTRFLFPNKESFFKYLLFYLFLSIPLTILGYYQFRTGSDPGVSNLTYFINDEGKSIIRPSASFYYNSSYGQFVFMMFLVIMSLLNIKYFLKKWLLILSTFIANLVGLLISGQRSAWAALGAQISFLLMLTPVLPKKYSFAPKLIFFSLISLVIIFAALPESYESFHTRVDSTMSDPDSKGYMFTYRMEKISIGNILKNSPLFGHGPGTATPASRHLGEPTESKNEFEGGVEGGYVQMCWEIGILGLLIFAWLIASLFRFTFTVRRELNDPELKQLSILGTLICSGYMIANITAGMLNTASTAIIFWFLLGIIPALKGWDKSDEKNSISTY